MLSFASQKETAAGKKAGGSGDPAGMSQYKIVYNDTDILDKRHKKIYT